jgi:hypothetical protein
MSSDVTALVVAVAGVAGTLASAVIMQVLAMRSRSREIEAQDHQRREDRAQNTQRPDVKTAIATYLETAQHVQTQLYAREHGRDFEDVSLMVEQIWLAHAQVDILCSEGLRLPLLRHAQALNESGPARGTSPGLVGLRPPPQGRSDGCPSGRAATR